MRTATARTRWTSTSSRGSDERRSNPVGPVTVTLQAFLYSVFNNQIRTQQDTAYTINQPDGYPDTIYDPNVPSNNPEYVHILAPPGHEAPSGGLDI